jgi:hypothetical protein
MSQQQTNMAVSESWTPRAVLLHLIIAAAQAQAEPRPPPAAAIAAGSASRGWLLLRTSAQGAADGRLRHVRRTPQSLRSR